MYCGRFGCVHTYRTAAWPLGILSDNSAAYMCPGLFVPTLTRSDIISTVTLLTRHADTNHFGCTTALSRGSTSTHITRTYRPRCSTGRGATKSLNEEVHRSRVECLEDISRESYSRSSDPVLNSSRQSSLSETFKEAFPEQDDAASKPYKMWGVSIDPLAPAKDARVSVLLMKFLRARYASLSPSRMSANTDVDCAEISTPKRQRTCSSRLCAGASLSTSRRL